MKQTDIHFCHISPISSESEKYFRQKWYVKSKHTFYRIISSTNFNAQFSLFVNNMFVTLLSSTCFEH